MILAVRAGNYMETAAAFAGIPKSTLYDWLRYGVDDRVNNLDTAFVHFSDAVKKALAESEISDLMIITRHARDNWQAAAWRLERKFPKRWGRKRTFVLEEETDDDDVLVIEAAGTEDEYIQAMQRARGETNGAAKAALKGRPLAEDG